MSTAIPPLASPARVLAALALAAALAAPPPAAPGLARPPAAGAHAAAQPGPPGPEAPPLEVAVFGDAVTVRTLPGVVVGAELLGPDGAPKVVGQGFSEPDGRADVRFFAFDDPGADAVVRPGDTLRLAVHGERPRTVAIPALVADVDADADAVRGTAPAGMTLDVELVVGTAAPAVVRRQATAAADGTFAVELAGEVDLPVGGVTGTVAFADAEGTRFVARVAALRAELTLGSGWVRGAVTPGTSIDVALRSAATGNVGRAAVGEVVGGAEWSAQLPPTTGGGGPGPGPGPGPGFPGARAEHRVAPGDVVTATVSGGPLGGTGGGRALVAVVPALAVSIDPGDDAVAGRGPAGAELIVRASSLDGASVERRVLADGAGAFAVSLADAVDLGPGWRMRVDWEAAPGLRIGALAVVPATEVAMGTDVVRGLADVGAAVTVTLRGDGGVLWQRALRADDRGEYRTATGFALGGPPAVIEAGMRVEVAEVAGDPRVLEVPDLTAAPDEGGAIAGAAPPGSVVRVVATDRPDLAPLDAVADGSGRYRAPAAAAGWPMDAALAGSATLAAPDGFRVVARWAVVRLGLELGQHVVVGNGPLGRGVAGELVDAEGRVVARAAGQVPDFGGANVVIIGGAGLGGFTLEFLDVAGDPVPIRAGDAIRIAAGDGALALAVPELSAAVFVADDVVTGRTAPGLPVTLRVQPAIGGERVEVTADADASGAFAHDLGDAFDIRYRDRVQLEVRPGGHRVTARVPVAGLEVDLDAGTVQGALTPDARLVAQLRRGGAILAEADARAAADGTFALGLRGAGGTALALRAGDVVDVVDASAGGESLRLTVPELAIEAAAGAPAVAGRAAPGGTLVVLATGAGGYLDGVLGQAWPEIGADGRWTAELVPTTPVRPGLAVIGQYQLPSGHVVRRTAFVALLVADHGGARACGVSQPGTAVSARLEAGGAVRATGSGAPDPDGRFGVALADGAGALVATHAGDAVRAEMAGAVATVVLPPLDVRYDPATSRLTGTGAPGAPFRLSYPARRCSGADEADFLLVLGGATRVADDGSLSAFFPADFVAPGQGFEMAFEAEGGHGYRRQFWRSLGRVYVGTTVVSGRSQPLAAVTVTLRSAAGDERAQAHAMAGADGDWRVALGAISAPGDVVVVAASEDVAPPAAIAVAPLAFDWSPGRPVVGTAPPAAAVLLELRLASGRVLAIGRQADAAGRFGFDATEVPPRADWSLGDVAALRATLATPDGHAIVAETEGFDGPPTSPAGAIYLPALANRASPAAAEAESAPPAAAPSRAPSAHPRRPAARTVVRLPALR